MMIWLPLILVTCILSNASMKVTFDYNIILFISSFIQQQPRLLQLIGIIQVLVLWLKRDEVKIDL